MIFKNINGVMYGGDLYPSSATVAEEAHKEY